MSALKLSLVLPAAFVLTACNVSEASANDSFTTLSTSITAGENPQVDKELQFLREEEKLARDVYLSLAELYDVPIFSNIASAEQRHMELLGSILEQAGIADPVQNDAVGVFVNAELAALYVDLVQQGKVSLVDALIVGATIEDLDIKDITQMMQNSNDEALSTTWEVLKCGSDNHLRAFIGMLEGEGASYSPQFISPNEFDAIINSDRVRCGQAIGVGQGQGQGRSGQGMRNGQGQGQGRSGQGMRNGRGQGRNGQGMRDGSGRGQGRRNGKGQGRGNGRGRGQGQGPRDGSCVNR